MEFLLHDRVIVRNHAEYAGRAGIVAMVTPASPPPYQVVMGDAMVWVDDDQLMLECKCDVVRGGCTCGAMKREREANEQ